MGGGQYSLQMQFTDNNLLGHEAGWGKAESESGGTSKRLRTPVLHALTRSQRGPLSKVPTQGRTSPAEVWGGMPQARNSKWKDPEEGSAWSHPRKRKVTAEGARDKDYRIIPGVQITQDFTAHCPRPWRRQRAAHHRRWAHPQESLIRLTCDGPDTVHF